MAKLTAEEKRLQVQQHEGSDEMETYLYYKNSRFKVEAGTQAAVVRWKVGPGQSSSQRKDEMGWAMAQVIRVYVERWGKIEWWLATVTCHHVTNSIVVELRVRPA